MRKQTYLISLDQQNVATSSLVCDMVKGTRLQCGRLCFLSQTMSKQMLLNQYVLHLR